MKGLKGQKILVTGASRGIGHSIADYLLGQGALVAVHYRNSSKPVLSLEKKYKNQAFPVHADLEQPGGGEQLFEEALRLLGGLDSLVINAGIFEAANIEDPLDQWLDNWYKTLHINLTMSGLLTKLAINHFETSGQGRLIYIGSRAAFRGETKEYLAYAASKGGLTSLAKSVARSFGKSNIKAFVVAPGFVATDMAEQAIAQIGKQKVLNELALNTMTQPEDVAPVVALMCSGQMDHATGTTIDINAGSHIR